ncbi:hypothetical protein MY3296_007859 [Beauveria thailandica]
MKVATRLATAAAEGHNRLSDSVGGSVSGIDYCIACIACNSG